MIYLVYIFVGLVIGGGLMWMYQVSKAARKQSPQIEEAEQRAAEAENRASTLQGAATELRAQSEKTAEDFKKTQDRLENENSARVEAETRLAETEQKLKEEMKLLEEAKEKLTDAFKAIAGDTLDNSTTAFLKLAKETFDKVLIDAKGDLGQRQEAIKGLVKPLSESLNEFKNHVSSIEKERNEAYAGLTEHLKSMSSAEQQLQKETANLVTALRKPDVRGRWGEMTLHRVVELAGMVERCDFSEQVTTDSEQGRMRPDLIVRLPADREIVVDAKVSLDAYLDAISADNEEDRKKHMARHASSMRTHMQALAGKQYWNQFDNAPEFVVMFIPGEAFFGAAVDADIALLEDGLEKRVILATPTTLIALMRAVAYGWKQEQLAENAQEISELGKQLYERMRALADHVGDIGKGLEKANTAYNKAAGSLEARVLPAARRFKDLGVVTGADVPHILPVETAPRVIIAPEIESSENE